MNFGWFMMTYWWFISSHNILLASRTCLDIIFTDLLFHHWHPRSEDLLCEAVRCWLEGNWEAPTSISKPRLKPPGRPATTWNERKVSRGEELWGERCPWKTGRKPKQVWSCSLEHPQKCMASSSNLGLQLRHNELGQSSKITRHLIKHISNHEPMIWPNSHTIFHQRSIPIILSCHPTTGLFPPHPPSLQHWNGCVLPAPGSDTCCSHLVTSQLMDASSLKTHLGPAGFCCFRLGPPLDWDEQILLIILALYWGLKFPPNIFGIEIEEYFP